MFVTETDEIWVTADFKETQLARMHRGERVTIHVDTFGRDYHGYVRNLPGASGDRFSLLPAENATGNYVKVVQRLPVQNRVRPRSGSRSSAASRNVSGAHGMAAIAAPRIAATAEAPAQRPGAQSMGDRAGSYDGDVHGAARHQHLQRLAAAHRRRPRHQLRRKHLGADQLPGRQRDHPADERVAQPRLRPQALLHDVRRAVHRELVSMRRRTEPGNADRRFACCRESAAAASRRSNRRSWSTLSPRRNSAALSRSTAWRSSRRRRSARRWADGSPTASRGDGFSSSTFRSDCCRCCFRAGWCTTRSNSPRSASRRGAAADFELTTSGSP